MKVPGDVVVRLVCNTDTDENVVEKRPTHNTAPPDLSMSSESYIKWQIYKEIYIFKIYLDLFHVLKQYNKTIW